MAQLNTNTYKKGIKNGKGKNSARRSQQKRYFQELLEFLGARKSFSKYSTVLEIHA